MRLEHTCSPRPRCRWLTGASPRQSSWQTEWDQWLSQGVQDFSPLPGFVPSHTGATQTTHTSVLICSKNKKSNEPWGENNSLQRDSNSFHPAHFYKWVEINGKLRASHSSNNQRLTLTLAACVSFLKQRLKIFCFVFGLWRVKGVAANVTTWQVLCGILITENWFESGFLLACVKGLNFWNAPSLDGTLSWCHQSSSFDRAFYQEQRSKCILSAHK